MSFLANVLRILDSEMTRPETFGWFHIMWLLIIAAATILLCRFGGHVNEEKISKIVLWVAVAVAVLEVYKQINYTFIVKDGVINTDYQWYIFPFQFCSMPMYVGILQGVVKKGKVRSALLSFLATYGLFAGLCVMVYPGDVFIRTIGINIQTMICHGTMVVIGVYLLYTGAARLCHKTILGALAVFSWAVLVAVTLNEIMFYSGVLGDETFNMFFVSRHFEPSLPVYSLVQDLVPYPFCLIIYIAGFTAAAYIILLLAMLAKKIFGTKEQETCKNDI